MEGRTFRAWLEDKLGRDQIIELAEHGADTGWPGLTYYSETGALYGQYEDEIWQALEDDADSQGCTPLALIASFNGAKNVHGNDQFRNLLVWFMAERTANEIANCCEN